MAHRGDVVAPADQVNQPVDIGLFYFAYRKASWQRRYVMGWRKSISSTLV
ncbi:hypothetical protein ACOISQ_001485 [Salmonella enterica]